MHASCFIPVVLRCLATSCKLELELELKLWPARLSSSQASSISSASVVWLGFILDFIMMLGLDWPHLARRRKPTIFFKLKWRFLWLDHAWWQFTWELILLFFSRSLHGLFLSFSFGCVFPFLSLYATHLRWHSVVLPCHWLNTERWLCLLVSGWSIDRSVGLGGDIQQQQLRKV